MTPSDSCRAGSMKPQVLTTTTSAPSASGDEGVAVLGQLAEHALGIDEVLRTAEADEGEGRFGHGIECRLL